MKFKFLFVFGISLILISRKLVYAVPPPCDQVELLETSDYAIEGDVVNVECGEAYDSGECRPWTQQTEVLFKPELFSDCTATVKVSKNLKGEYNVGEEVRITFKKLIQSCQGGDPAIPGSATKDFRLNSRIRYYHSSRCAYWNFEEIEKQKNESPAAVTPTVESSPQERLGPIISSGLPRATSTPKPVFKLKLKKLNWFYLIPISIIGLLVGVIVYRLQKKR